MDDSTVRALYHALLAAWNKRKADDYAKLFLADGYAVGFDGSYHEGAEKIRADIGKIFTHHPTGRYVGKVRDVRFLNNDVGILRAVAGMVLPNESDLYPPLNVIQTVVAVKRESKWLISVFQNTPAAFHGRPEQADSLTQELRAELNTKG